jgi:transmembrane sensor
MMRPGDARRRDLEQLADYITGALAPAVALETRERIDHDEEFRELAEPVLAVIAHDTMPMAPGGRTPAKSVTRRVPASQRRRHWVMGPILAFAAVAFFYVGVDHEEGGRRFLAALMGSPADIDVRTGIGETRTIRLPDGSRVTIGPESGLSYRAAYTERVQRVVLRGAATFDVVPQRLGVFRVAAGRAIVSVDGTRFAVRSYANDSTTTVSVFGGRALVGGPDLDGLPVDSGFQARVMQSSPKTLVGATTESIAWDQGGVRFENVPLPVAARELGRWYGTEMHLVDHDLAGRIVSASIPPTEHAGVAALCAAVNARAEWTSSGVMLYDGAGR